MKNVSMIYVRIRVCMCGRVDGHVSTGLCLHCRYVCIYSWAWIRSWHKNFFNNITINVVFIPRVNIRSKIPVIRELVSKASADGVVLASYIYTYYVLLSLVTYIHFAIFIGRCRQVVCNRKYWFHIFCTLTYSQHFQGTFLYSFTLVLPQ